MLARTLEPEGMDTAEEAREYDAMDHSAVNEVFVDDFLMAVKSLGLGARLGETERPLQVLDCGTGTALIPIVLARRAASVRVTAVDLSEEMLKVAQENVRTASLQ